MNGVKKIYYTAIGVDCLSGCSERIDDRRNGYDDTEERRQLESAAKILFG